MQRWQPVLADGARWPLGRRARCRVCRSRRSRWVVVPLTSVLTIVLAFNVVFLRYAHRQATLAHIAIEQARSDIVASDVDGAQASLDAAEQYLATAGETAGTWALSVLAPIPVVGSPARALATGARAGEEVVAAGRIMAGAAARLPGSGMHDFGQNLGLLYGATTATQEDLARAAAHLAAARQLLEGPAGAFLPPVADPARSLVTRLEKLEDDLDKAEKALRLTSELAAPGRDIRLLVLSQDSMELRPTGGLIGTFGVLHIVDGKVTLEEFSDVGTLPPPQPPMTPPAELAEALTQPWNIVNSNWWPDFPTSARTAAEMFARQRKVRVDGVIGMTEATVARLVGAFGPIHLPGYEVPVVQGGFDERVIHEVELKRPLDTPRKKFLIELAHEVFHRMLSVPEDKAAAVLHAFGESIAAGDLQMWFENPAWQSLLDPAVAGALATTGGDFLQLAEANMSASKANAGLVRQAEYIVRPDRQGRLVAHLQIRYRNDAPKSEINPYYNGLVRVYVPRGVELLSDAGTKFDAPDGPFSVLMTKIFVPPDGGTAVVAFDYVLPAGVVAPDGRYHLTWMRQPGTTRDTYAAYVADRRFELGPGERRLAVDVPTPSGG